MSDLSQNSYAFRPRAKIMSALGEELISSETVAILELVKNSYDADATKVKVSFSGNLKKGEGKIEIIDNGHGMDLGVVRGVWMEPATNMKRVTKRSSTLKRKFLGAKGIGRFAVARLAQELELVTKLKDTNEEVFAIFDWTQFEDEEKYLDEILILTETRKPEMFTPNPKDSFFRDLHNGTYLGMKYLKKTWDEEDCKKLQRGLSRLVSPFYKQSNFQISVQFPEGFSDYSGEISPPAIIKYPHYSITGIVREDGNYECSIQIYSLGKNIREHGYFIKMKNQKSKKWDLLSVSQDTYLGMTDPERPDASNFRKITSGKFDFELRIWDRDDLGNIEQKVGENIATIRQDLDAISGVNIYRDGFRVLPYGEPADDWLRLDLRRVQKPTQKLSQNQILGYINITNEGNPLLKDQSNREGLDENLAMDDLRNMILFFLREIEEERYKLRPRKGDKRDTTASVQGLFNTLNLNDLKSRLQQQYPQDEDSLALINEAQKRINNQIEEIQIVIARYQNLATLGTLIDVVLHDGRHPVSKIINESTLGSERLETQNSSEFTDDLKKAFQVIESQAKVLATLFRRIEPFGGRKRGKPGKYYLEELIWNAVAVLESEIKRIGVEIDFPKSETLMIASPSEIQQIIVNLIDNSLYWLQTQRKDQRKIFITVVREAEETVEILFSDSGPGIPQENQERVFDPYFSTKQDGVGLGLAIAGEIISDYYNGKFELIQSANNPLKGATFRITLKNRI